MAVYTPNGLKIKFPPEYAFGLLSRLTPRFNSKDVLLLTEVISILPKVTAFWTYIYCLIVKAPYYSVFIITLFIFTLTSLIRTLGFFVIPGLFLLGKVSKIISSFFLDSVLAIILGLLYANWKVIIAFFLAKFIGFLIEFILEITLGKHALKKHGSHIGITERNFIHAYQHYAIKCNAPLDLEVNKIEEEKAKDLILNYTWKLKDNKLKNFYK